MGTGDRHAVGGAVLDDLLKAYLSKQGVSATWQDRQTLKESFAAVADSREEYVEVLDEKKEVETLEHTLPDGQVVKIGKDRYVALRFDWFFKCRIHRKTVLAVFSACSFYQTGLNQHNPALV